MSKKRYTKQLPPELQGKQVVYVTDEGTRYDELPVGYSIDLGPQQDKVIYGAQDDGVQSVLPTDQGVIIRGNKSPADYYYEHAPNSVAEFVAPHTAAWGKMKYDYDENGNEILVPDHPYMDAFRSGSNDVGNIAELFLTAGLTKAAAKGLVGIVLNEGLTVGQKLGILAGALGGSVAGKWALDKVTKYLTNGRYNSTAQMRIAGGEWPINAALTDPGTIGGGYLGSKLAGALVQPATYGNQMEYLRSTVAPERLVELPGPKVTEVAPWGRYGFVYREPTGPGNRGVRSQNGHRESWGNPRKGNNNTGRITAVSTAPRVELLPKNSDRLPSRSNAPREQETTYVPTTWTFIPTPPDTLPPPPTIPVPKPKARFEVIQTTSDPFEEWFAKQKPGTVQWFNGVGSAHQAGPYWIGWREGVTANMQTRDVATGYDDPRGVGRRVPDSTSRIIVTAPKGRVVAKLPGQVAQGAYVSPEQIVTDEELQRFR